MSSTRTRLEFHLLCTIIAHGWKGRMDYSHLCLFTSEAKRATLAAAANSWSLYSSSQDNKMVKLLKKRSLLFLSWEFMVSKSRHGWRIYDVFAGWKMSVSRERQSTPQCSTHSCTGLMFCPHDGVYCQKNLSTRHWSSAHLQLMYLFELTHQFWH